VLQSFALADLKKVIYQLSVSFKNSQSVCKNHSVFTRKQDILGWRLITYVVHISLSQF
jgi:hypothetical protein